MARAGRVEVGVQVVDFAESIAAEFRRMADLLDPRGWYSVVEASRLLGESPATVRRKCEAGDLKARKVGKAWIVELPS